MHMKTTQWILRSIHTLPTNEMWNNNTLPDLLYCRIISFFHENFVASLLVLMQYAKARIQLNQFSILS